MKSGVLIIVIDTSGSMRELGKGMLTRNLLACILGELVQGRVGEAAGRVAVVDWGVTARELTIDPNEDLPALLSGGRPDAKPLIKVLDRYVHEVGSARVLLLTDGHLGRRAAEDLRKWRSEAPNCSVRALVVGPDASKAPLRGVVDSGGAFDAVDVLKALQTWRLGPRPAPPERVAELENYHEGG